jgi:predicted Zn-dependent protease
MAKHNWRKELGWTEDHCEELRTAAYSYIRQGKYDIALSIFEALTVLEPENSYDSQTLGALYVELNQPSKALKHLDQALKLEPNHTPTLLNLTKAFFMLGKKQDGINICKMLQNDPTPAVSSTAKALLLAYS